MIYWFWAVVAFYAGGFFGVIMVAWCHSIKEADDEARFARVCSESLDYRREGASPTAALVAPECAAEIKPMGS